MRLPFFRSSKVEPTKTVVAPPRPSSRPNLHLAETQLITNADTEASSGGTATNRLERESRTLSGNGQTIPIALSSISQQLPAGFLAAAPETLARLTINIPVDWVLPQLAIGRVTITLADLLPLLPDNAVHRPLPNGNSQYAVVLPLVDVVSALPADLLQHQEQTQIDIDTPEYTRFPKLFDDSETVTAPQRKTSLEETVSIAAPKLPEPVVAAQPAQNISPEPVKEEAPAPRPLAFTMAKPIPTADEPLPQITTAPAASTEGQITVSLRSLVAVMPDQIFICQRTDLWRRIDLDMRIALPSDLVLPQLKIARVRLPLGVAVGLMPRGILASPLPQISDDTIPIALQEIVSQIPQNLFASQTNSSELQEIDFSDSEIPTPFAEKSFTSEPVEVRAPEPVQSESTPAPGAQEPTPETIEIPSSSLEDEGLSIFAEKSVTVEPVVAQQQPIVEPEPVIAQQPAPVVKQTPEPVKAPEPVTPLVQQVKLGSLAETLAPRAASTPVVQPPAPVIETPAPIIEKPAPIAETPAPVIETPAPIVEPTPTFTEQSAFVPQIQPPTPAKQAQEASDFIEETQPAPVTQSAPKHSTDPSAFLANVNSCNAEELARIEGIDSANAQRIIDHRNTHGAFQSLESLRSVPGLSRKLLKSLAGPARRGLNRLLGVEHNEELTLQEVVRLTSQMKGVAGCSLATSDGVFITGQLPEHLDQEAISVFAPQLFRNVGRYTKELRVGEVTRLSVFTDQQPVSVFGAGDIFLVVIHDNHHFSKALLRRCERISQELAPLCRQRAAV